MSLQFTPGTGNTLDFGTIDAGDMSTATVSVRHGGNLSVIDVINNITFTGANPTLFSVLPTGEVFNVDGQTQLFTFTFAPLTSGTKTATATFNFHTNIDFTNTPGTSVYSLTGVAVSSAATGEAAALVQSFRRELVPINGTDGITLAYFDETDFNDTADTGSYIFRVEDIRADRVPTVRRVIITYFDLGVAALIATITSIDDTGATVVDSLSKSIGTAAAPGTLSTTFIDLTVTGYRPQLTLTRAANGGPIAISTVLITGTVEKGGSL